MEQYTARTLEEFTKELADALIASMSLQYNLRVTTEEHLALKTNGEKQALTVRFEDANIAPTIYTEDLYQRYLNGDNISDIADKMTEVVYRAHQDSPTLPTLTPEEAKKHITLTLVNTEQNQQLLEKTPHFEILGGELSAIPRWYVSDDASFVVSNDMASSLMLTPNEVLQIGQQNIDSQHFTAESMFDVLAPMIGEDIDMMPPMEGPQMIVLTSENRIQGSNALLSDEALKHVHEIIGDFAVLPSSIHEVICLPIDESLDPDMLRDMVHQVNMGEVGPEERLSDQVFQFDGLKLTVVGESFSMESPKMETPKIESPKIDSFSMKVAM